MDLKKYGHEFARMAIKTGEDYVCRAIDAWEKVKTNDPHYGIYKAALLELKAHPWGASYVERRARFLRWESEGDDSGAPRNDSNKPPQENNG